MQVDVPFLEVLVPIVIAYAGGNYRTVVGESSLHRGIRPDVSGCMLALANGQVMSCGNDSSLMWVWDVDKVGEKGRKRDALFSRAGCSRITCLVQLPGGRVLAGHSNGKLRIWDITTRSLQLVLREHVGAVHSVSVLDDVRVVSAGRDKTVRVWDTNTGQCTFTFSTTSSVLKFAVSCQMSVLRDGRVVTGTRHEPRLNVWNVNTGQCTQTEIHGHKACDYDSPKGHECCSVTCVLAMTDGGRVVSGSRPDNLLHVWDMTTMNRTITLRGHTQSIKGLSELPDGRVVSWSLDSTMRVWDLTTGTCVLSMHSPNISSMAVLPDGRILSGSVKALRVWR